MSDKETITNYRLSAEVVVGLTLITLKLTGQIDWSWWWVLAPFWLSLLILLAILVVAGVAIFCLRIYDR